MGRIAIEQVEELIRQTEQWRVFHKSRGAAGYIEALACSIRIKALREALRTQGDRNG